MKAEDLRKILDKVGSSVEKDMKDFGLSDYELQLVETTVASMKAEVFKKLMRKI